eukprot:CAMPEP_0202403972 /NCGR_PEP_ID=MMETSP1128-20130828/5342_1 /ASSEMBLY_ACC=CAM_ASM_000463 /TAXON_ID=3047 /ORGANISM="Dunaliella tertiolecta, Strain CCMP1320" /LENGTH=46 /DNA_ID= /DNA_START= /DNA_END= /DNA_ORIENTATION=
MPFAVPAGFGMETGREGVPMCLVTDLARLCGATSTSSTPACRPEAL